MYADLARPLSNTQVNRNPGGSRFLSTESGPQPLTPAEIAWLNGLPADPAEVGWADAQQLALLAQRVDRSETRSDHRLVQQRWAPVQEAYDRREARQILDRFYRSLPDPTEAFAALIQREVGGLSWEECAGRGRVLAEEVNAALVQRRQHLKDSAQRTLDQANERARVRTTTDGPLIDKPVANTGELTSLGMAGATWLVG